ncbi:PilT protein domain protein [Candidatus Moduliflexus flocculans]|uniref:PilT protein domain protein n=1 Tax=Candidatus Moduliflexus flocculans TaxID=1499966 RepID=A0A081BRT3_9BACT|nr:PilT protein domain protein [Candidatus Moduliflexus flocculans]
MSGILVDSNVILDIFEDDPNWFSWSETQLEHYSALEPLYINSVIYAEISIGFRKIEELEYAVAACGFGMLDIPKIALLKAGKTFINYRKRGGSKTSPLPDFLLALMRKAPI